MGRRRWHPTPVLLPGKSHGQRSLVGCSPQDHKESDTTERLHFHFSLSCIGEGNGNPLQCSCLENPMDKGAWWATVLGFTKSQTPLKQLSRQAEYNRSVWWLPLVSGISGGNGQIFSRQSYQISVTNYIKEREKSRLIFFPKVTATDQAFTIFWPRFWMHSLNCSFPVPGFCPNILGGLEQIKACHLPGYWP